MTSAIPALDKIKWPKNGTTKVSWVERGMYGQTCWMSARTAAHLAFTQRYLDKHHPGAKVVVIQGGYNAGKVAASAGTHDYDACLDVYITGLSWTEMEKVLRRCGWAAWHRRPPSFGNHIHMISLGYNTRVGYLVPGQVKDYFAHKDGLKYHRADRSWHPENINSTIFSYRKWLEQEVDMANIADQLIPMKVGPDDKVREVPLKAVLQDLEGTQDKHGAKLDDIETKLDDILALLRGKA